MAGILRTAKNSSLKPSLRPYNSEALRRANHNPKESQSQARDLPNTNPNLQGKKRPYRAPSLIHFFQFLLIIHQTMISRMSIMRKLTIKTISVTSIMN